MTTKSNELTLGALPESFYKDIFNKLFPVSAVVATAPVDDSAEEIQPSQRATTKLPFLSFYPPNSRL
jgi:hypothetical protein